MIKCFGIVKENDLYKIFALPVVSPMKPMVQHSDECVSGASTTNYAKLTKVYDEGVYGQGKKSGRKLVWEKGI